MCVLTVLKAFKYLFTVLFIVKLFICFLEYAYWNLLKFPSLWLVGVLQCPSLIGCRGNAPTVLVTGGFLYGFQDRRLLSTSVSSFQQQSITKCWIPSAHVQKAPIFWSNRVVLPKILISRSSPFNIASDHPMTVNIFYVFRKWIYTCICIFSFLFQI